MTIFTLLLIGMTSAQAQTALSCGAYTRADNHLTLHVLSSNQIQQHMDASAPYLLYYEISNNELTTFNLDMAGKDTFTLGADGKSLIDQYETVYTLSTPASCIAPLAIPDSRAWPACKDDREACLFVYGGTPPDEMQTLCRDGLYFVCNQMPNAIRQHERIKPGKRGKTTPLPDAGLATLKSNCLDNISAHTCEIASKELWIAGRYLDARAMMEHACAAPTNHKKACEMARDLAPLTEAMLALPAATALPVGVFTTSTGLMREWSFGADDIVSDASGKLQMRAHIHNGIINVTHPNGGNFSFQPVGDDYLLGIDSWTQRMMYKRQH